jgi:hypothetical protein
VFETYSHGSEFVPYIRDGFLARSHVRATELWA